MNRIRRLTRRYGVAAALALLLAGPLAAAAGHGPAVSDGPGGIVRHLTGTAAVHSSAVADGTTDDTAWGR
ncbi:MULTISPECIES: hypothetical protein [unclassified Streptomyces]|uniref:hypothetical protein n=1 Tax=unclassified Streptomyces TaxID=2593676 RepID=UPI0035E1565C